MSHSMHIKLQVILETSLSTQPSDTDKQAYNIREMLYKKHTKIKL